MKNQKNGSSWPVRCGDVITADVIKSPPPAPPPLHRWMEVGFNQFPINCNWVYWFMMNASFLCVCVIFSSFQMLRDAPASWRDSFNISTITFNPIWNSWAPFESDLTSQSQISGNYSNFHQFRQLADYSAADDDFNGPNQLDKTPLIQR